LPKSHVIVTLFLIHR